MLGYYNERDIWSLSEIKKKNKTKQWFNLMQDPPADKMRDNGPLNANLKYYFLMWFRRHMIFVFESAIFCLTTR